MSTWTIGGSFAAALALAVILGWQWGRRQPVTDQPLGLPEGSVRGIIALLVTLAVILFPFVAIEIPKPIESAFLIIIGLYFGARAQQAANEAAQRSRTARATPDAGYAMPWTLGALSLAAMAFAAVVFVTGCTSSGLRTVQGGVNFVARKAGGQNAVDAIDSFRTAEGRLYAEENGLISTQGLLKVTELYAVDEGRWITGRVIPRERLIRDLAPVGDAPAVPSTLTLINTNSPAAERPPAITPAPPPAPAAGGSLTGPATGGIVQ